MVYVKGEEDTGCIWLSGMKPEYGVVYEIRTNEKRECSFEIVNPLVRAVYDERDEFGNINFSVLLNKVWIKDEFEHIKLIDIEWW